MAPQIGNKHWLERMRSGRYRKIESPEILWSLFIEYVENTTNEPFEEQDWVGKDAIPVSRERIKPLLKSGFAAEIGLSEWRVISEYRGVSNEFSQIVSRIESYITSYNVSGAAAGLLNPNIIARVEGLSEKTENAVSVVPATYDEFLNSFVGGAK